ncbi:hypothetical protein JTE90_024536 [Oedothorax gibbosus]|uniref:Uncharacterized protein n=1 Tax=Oedothorax gibbosus TaxID=931172 RepID=A0AAV6VC31_9ARAC|nr:hypothetical protein JTE90_024536 [Oedothorax gibbosus]
MLNIILPLKAQVEPPFNHPVPAKRDTESPVIKGFNPPRTALAGSLFQLIKPSKESIVLLQKFLSRTFNPQLLATKANKTPTDAIFLLSTPTGIMEGRKLYAAGPTLTDSIGRTVAGFHSPDSHSGDLSPSCKGSLGAGLPERN